MFTRPLLTNAYYLTIIVRLIAEFHNFFISERYLMFNAERSMSDWWAFANPHRVNETNARAFSAP